MLNKKQGRIAIVYVLLQVVVWAKSIWFFLLFGYGKVLHFNEAAFPAGMIVLDYFFHETVHVLIGLLALLFGYNMQKLDWNRLVAVVLVAVFLHNLFYWITASHPSIEYAVFDFARDFAILLLVVIVGFAIRKFRERYL